MSLLRRLSFVPWLALSACAATPAPSFPPLVPARARLVDLTHPFDSSTVYWPADNANFEHEKLFWGKSPGGWFYASAKMCAPEHGGTHLDAPIHFAEGRATADRIPLERLVAPAVVIDISAAAAKDRDTLLGAADIEAFERANGPIAAGTIVLVRTNWSERWPDKKRYLGDDKPGDASNLHFPGVGEDAARMLVARKVAAAGIDTASIDNGPSKNFMTHRVLMEADIPAFENVTSLKELPARGATVIALPMKIGGGSGGPLRIVAVIPPT